MGLISRPFGKAALSGGNVVVRKLRRSGDLQAVPIAPDEVEATLPVSIRAVNGSGPMPDDGSQPQATVG